MLLLPHLPTSTTHDLFNMSKTAIIQLEIRNRGWWKRPEPKATLKLIRNPNLSSQCNRLPNNVLNDLNSPVCTIDELPSYVNLCTEKLCGFSQLIYKLRRKS